MMVLWIAYFSSAKLFQDADFVPSPLRLEHGRLAPMMAGRPGFRLLLPVRSRQPIAVVRRSVRQCKQLNFSSSEPPFAHEI